MEISLTKTTISIGLKVAGFGIYSLMLMIYGTDKYVRLQGLAAGLVGAGWIISDL